MLSSILLLATIITAPPESSDINLSSVSVDTQIATPIPTPTPIVQVYTLDPIERERVRQIRDILNNAAKELDEYTQLLKMKRIPDNRSAYEIDWTGQFLIYKAPTPNPLDVIYEQDYQVPKSGLHWFDSQYN